MPTASLLSERVRTDPWRLYPAKSSQAELQTLGASYPVWFLTMDAVVERANLLALWLWGAIDPVTRRLHEDSILGQHVFSIILSNLRRIPLDQNREFAKKKMSVLKKVDPNGTSDSVRYVRARSDLHSVFESVEREPPREWCYRLRIVNPVPGPGAAFLSFEVNVNRVLDEHEEQVGFLVAYRSADGATRRILDEQVETLKRRYGADSYVRTLGAGDPPEPIHLPHVIELTLDQISEIRPHMECPYCGGTATYQLATRYVDPPGRPNISILVHAHAYSCRECGVDFYPPETNERINERVRQVISTLA